jgi:hypothetical protein
MTFKPAIWYPIAAVLSALNVAAIWFAAQPGEAWHAAGHGALAVAFGLWAQRLKQRRDGSALQAGLEDLEIEVGTLRQELGEAQERMDFTERMLAREADSRRVDAPRGDPRP